MRARRIVQPLFLVFVFLGILGLNAYPSTAQPPPVDRTKQRPVPRIVTLPDPVPDHFCSKEEKDAAQAAAQQEFRDAGSNLRDAQDYRVEIERHLERLEELDKRAEAEELRRLTPEIEALKTELQWAGENIELHAGVYRDADSVTQQVYGIPVIDCGRTPPKSDRRFGFNFNFGGGGGFASFSDVETAVCDAKVLPDFGAAGYDTSSCTADESHPAWYAGFSTDTSIVGRLGIHAGLSYRNLGGPETAYEGTRVRNDLFRGGGTYDLEVVQVSLGPSVRISDSVRILPSVYLDWWSNDFEITNQLQSAGRIVNESNASGSESGFAVNYGVALDWFFGGPIGIRGEWQHRCIDDAVVTDVTGLPANADGSSVWAGVVVQLGK